MVFLIYSLRRCGWFGVTNVTCVFGWLLCCVDAVLRSVFAGVRGGFCVDVSGGLH